MPGQKISEADRKKIDVKLICNLCSLLLSSNPMQTACGCLLCYECLQTLFRSSNATCPLHGSELSPDNVHADAFHKRELMALHLHCPNKDCDWSGTYKVLQEHSIDCGQALVRCVHNACKKEVKRSLLAEHLQQECRYREITCNHCKEKIAFNLLKEHVDVECLDAPLVCEHCAMSGLRRREMEQHKTIDCEEILTDCEFKAIGCNHYKKVKNRRDMRLHWKDELLLHVQLLLYAILDLSAKLQNLISKVEIVATLQAAHEELKQLVRSFATDLNALGEKLTALFRTLTALQKRVENIEKGPGAGGNDSRTAGIRRLEGEIREKDALISQLKERLDLMDTSLAAMTVRLSDVATSPSQIQVMSSFNGTLLWRIDAFSCKRRDAVGSVQTAIYSPHFYTSQFGYKMCARIYLNGDGFGKETHISLFFVVMKGEHDALLPWPFQKKITMMMLDQNTGDHMVDAFRSDPESSSFQRPKNNMNVASGSPLFMPLDGLNNRVYVKDDTMFIKIIVD